MTTKPQEPKGETCSGEICTKPFKVANGRKIREGDTIWMVDGELHRDDGPAHIDVRGNQFWYRNGLLHREDGPASIEHAAGMQVWYFNGMIHREDGPAYICVSGYYIGTYKYMKCGRCHREDGPAVRTHDGKLFWYLDDFRKRDLISYLAALKHWGVSEADMIAIKLKYG